MNSFGYQLWFCRAFILKLPHCASLDWINCFAVNISICVTYRTFSSPNRCRGSARSSDNKRTIQKL